ncbi:MAG: DUF3047 domain-containing protein [Sterolibacterium sp.]|jgi:hypothetical protein
MLALRTSFLSVALMFASQSVSAEAVWVGKFEAAATSVPAPWRVEQIDKRVPPTEYHMRVWDGVNAVEAHAIKSMAVLARPVDIDLAITPVLCWRWRIDAPIKSADMTQKSGDDYAARVYLTFEIPPEQLGLGVRTKLRMARFIFGDHVPDAALNYVWDNSHPVGTTQENAYTDRARMLVLRSGSEQAGSWVDERREVLTDFRQAFGDVSARLSALAIASDTDNTGEDAHAGFAEFRFVSKDTNCPRP